MHDRDTRKRILEAAREQFLARSYGGATLREIASAADVTTGSLYHHFAGKDELFVEVCETGLRRLQQRFQTAMSLSEGRSLTERLGALFDAYAAFFLEERGYYDLIERLERGRDQLSIRPELMERVDRASREVIGHVIAVIRAARPDLAEDVAVTRALVLVALAEGTFACERRGFLSRYGQTFGALRAAVLGRSVELLGQD